MHVSGNVTAYVGGHQQLVFLGLQVTSNRLRRWFGEPLKAVILATSAFGSNKRGYPVLSKPLQDWMHQCCKQHVQVGRKSGASNVQQQNPLYT